MKKPFLLIVPVTLAMGSAAFAAPPAPTFTPLGFLAGDVASEAYSISRDGQTIVGFSGTNGDASPAGGANSEAVYWDVSNAYAITSLGAGIARDVSSDGSVIVGSTGTYGAKSESFHVWENGAKWTNGVLQVLPNLGAGGWSNAYAVSADGSKVVGGSSTTTNPGSDPLWNHNNWQRAVTWNAGLVVSQMSVSGAPDVDSYPTHLFDLPATGVSSDGTVISGYKQGPVGTIGFRSANGGDTTLSAVLGPRSWVNDVSDDGDVIVGGAWDFNAAGDASRGAAVRYVGTTRELLGKLPTAPTGSLSNEGEAKGTDKHGRVVVGAAAHVYEYIYNGLPGSTQVTAAFIWDERTDTMQNLNTILADAGVNIGNRWLSDANEVINNPDGTITIVGTALTQFHPVVGFPIPVGTTEAFVFNMVNPANLAGDANQDGVVNIGDLTLLAGSFGNSGIWADGDFNYDGTVNIGDLTLLAGNFGTSTSGATPIPEPAALSLLALGGLALIRRR